MLLYLSFTLLLSLTLHPVHDLADAPSLQIPLERCFPERIAAWRPKLQDVIPSYGRRLNEDPGLLAEVRAETMQTLELNG